MVNTASLSPQEDSPKEQVVMPDSGEVSVTPKGNVQLEFRGELNADPSSAPYWINVFPMANGNFRVESSDGKMKVLNTRNSVQVGRGKESMWFINDPSHRKFPRIENVHGQVIKIQNVSLDSGVIVREFAPEPTPEVDELRSTIHQHVNLPAVDLEPGASLDLNEKEACSCEKPEAIRIFLGAFVTQGETKTLSIRKKSRGSEGDTYVITIEDPDNPEVLNTSFGQLSLNVGVIVNIGREIENQHQHWFTENSKFISRNQLEISNVNGDVVIRRNGQAPTRVINVER